MSKVKKENKQPAETKKKSSKKSKDELEEFAFHDELQNEDEEVLGELDEEDDEEFMTKVKEFEKEHSKAKMVDVYDKLGNPPFKKVNELNPEKLEKSYKDLLCRLDKANIIVHFHNDYPVKEKYRFITEEVFKEAVEDVKSKQHITFIYEDFHPEMDDEEEEEELY